jgi:hypothetical protein
MNEESGSNPFEDHAYLLETHKQLRCLHWILHHHHHYRIYLLPCYLSTLKNSWSSFATETYNSMHSYQALVTINIISFFGFQP